MLGTKGTRIAVGTFEADGPAAAAACAALAVGARASEPLILRSAVRTWLVLRERRRRVIRGRPRMDADVMSEISRRLADRPRVAQLCASTDAGWHEGIAHPPNPSRGRVDLLSVVHIHSFSVFSAAARRIGGSRRGAAHECDTPRKGSGMRTIV
jgi:hypothetical protein